jgi:pimeloyl-ACP methyl ester carboxylesterase
MKVILIHGANATKVCWNWIGSNIKKHDRFEWEMMSDPEENLSAMEAQLKGPAIVVGHSMGGLYAWHLAQRHPDKIVAGISVATPWGGILQAELCKLFNFSIPWLRMVSRMEPWTAQPRLVEPPVPWTNVVCTHGFDLWGIGPNDGVVTVGSQMELAKPWNEIRLDYGHNEVLQSQELLDIIQR